MNQDEFVCEKYDCDSCGYCVLIQIPEDDEEALELFFKLKNR